VRSVEYHGAAVIAASAPIHLRREVVVIGTAWCTRLALFFVIVLLIEHNEACVQLILLVRVDVLACMDGHCCLSLASSLFGDVIGALCTWLSESEGRAILV
jgi:hypothetical protein